MKINIAKSSGFCFGVKLALDKAKDIAGKRKNVYVLGDIVHNEFVVRNLKDLGIKKTKRIHPAKNATLIIRAHGAPLSIFKKARSYGYRLVDATCPKVKDIYKIARKLEKTSKIIIIGDKNHDEVKGIAGQLKKRPVIIENLTGIDKPSLSRIKKAAVITQSTQTKDNIERVIKALRPLIKDLKLYDTTCRITQIKQREIRSLPKDNDLVLIIGSKTSANTKHLYEISKKINKRTYWIQSEKNIKRTWLKGVRTVGIMAGASTPEVITRKVVERLKTFDSEN